MLKRETKVFKNVPQLLISTSKHMKHWMLSVYSNVFLLFPRNETSSEYYTHYYWKSHTDITVEIPEPIAQTCLSPEVPKGLASKWQYQMGALMQRAVLTAAALGSALAGAQLTHFVLKPDTRIPEYKPKKE